jgi:predicted enzyme related to lactoylglutathione lyase
VIVNAFRSPDPAQSAGKAAANYGQRETGAVAATPSITWTTITIDCADAETLGAFYSRLLGWAISARDDAGWVQLRHPNGGVGINLQAEERYEPPVWPEQPGRQGKMMHLEVMVDDLEAAVRLVLRSGGAEAAHQPADRDSTRLRVMLDPAGHPFCLFLAGE